MGTLGLGHSRAGTEELLLELSVMTMVCIYLKHRWLLST